MCTATPGIFWGPPSIFGYTILQDFFTVLAIKEVVSVTRHFIKGSSSSLRANRSILLAMVENWEDLAKTARYLVWPRPLHRFSGEKYRRAPLNHVGWWRFIISGIIALWLFGIDMVLIVLSVPNRAPQEAQFMTKLKWSSTADIPKLTQETTLQGSFSKSIKLESDNNDVEFTRLPSLSLERTDFRDFEVPIPEFPTNGSGRVFFCNNAEGWRIICRVRCDKRYYQYKLRLDIVTDTSNSSYFVPTTTFSMHGPNNSVDDYAQAMEEQLGIQSSGTRINKNGTYFDINSTTLPDEYTELENGDKVLTHDAIATLFLGSIEISAEPVDGTYYERKSGERQENKGREPHGVIAISKRPYLPLVGTIVFYVLLQLISLLQQKVWNLHTHNNEMTALLEISGGDFRENLSNIVVEDRPLIESEAGVGSQWLRHVGYLPADIIRSIQDYLREGRIQEKLKELGYDIRGDSSV